MLVELGHEALGVEDAHVLDEYSAQEVQESGLAGAALLGDEAEDGQVVQRPCVEQLQVVEGELVERLAVEVPVVEDVVQEPVDGAPLALLRHVVNGRVPVVEARGDAVLFRRYYLAVPRRVVLRDVGEGVALLYHGDELLRVVEVLAYVLL